MPRRRRFSYLKDDFLQFQTQRLEESRLRICVPPMAKASFRARDDAVFPLMDNVQEFLLSTDYKQGGPILLYINLPFIDNSAQDLIEKQCHSYSRDQIQETKLNYQFFLICDGYDEEQVGASLHQANRPHRRGQWGAKMIISCQSEFLEPVYLYRFFPEPEDDYKTARSDLFQEVVIAPFSNSQIENLMRMLRIPNLVNLVMNLFLLTFALEAVTSVPSVPRIWYSGAPLV